jgi:hypothetical protein
MLSIALFQIGEVCAQQSTKSYIYTSADIANPERGWYDGYYSHNGGSSLSTTYVPLKAQELIKNREKDNITLILRLFYLHEFIDQANVSAEYLTKIQADFDSIRAAGVKCIVRFAYSASQSAAIWDATPEKVFSHIESLGSVLSSNADVIAGVQAGFIGAWGEWYYTKNFATNGYIPNEEDQLNRRKVVEELLKILPENISVQGRTPAIMRNIVQSNEPISKAEAFDGSFKSRVGHHNDCFLANKSDYGTYVNLDTDLAYLRESTKYTIAGGETCDASNSYSDCVNASPRMADLHWTYLNRDYNKQVYDKWIQQGCYNEINIALGYRIYLTESLIDDSVNSGSALNLSLTFVNEGYAAPTQYKPIKIVLSNTLTGSRIALNYSGTNEDVRFWLPGEIQLQGQVIVPDTLADGSYTLGLQFSDQNPVLAKNPAYSIQLANVGIWDSLNGLNMLNHMVSVGTGGEGSLPQTPTDMGANPVSETQIQLTWLDASDNETGFELVRSTKEENNWVKIADLNSNTQEYLDENLKPGTLYYYMIRATNTYGNSEWSTPASVITLGVTVNSIPSSFVAIYPNPLLESNLNIQFGNKMKKEIVVTKLSGQIVYKKICNETRFQIDRSIFKSGIYFISIVGDDEIMNKKLLVL